MHVRFCPVTLVCLWVGVQPSFDICSKFPDTRSPCRSFFATHTPEKRKCVLSIAWSSPSSPKELTPLLSKMLTSTRFFQQQIRGIAPVPQNPAVLPHHAAAASTTQKGSIVAGYPVRTQASPAAFPPASSQVKTQGCLIRQH